MNQVYDVWEVDQKGFEVLYFVDCFGEFIIVYFCDEEVYMEEIGYVGIILYKLIYKDLLDKFMGFVIEICVKGGEVLEKFLIFFKFWLMVFIWGIDMKYGLKVVMFK